VSQGSPAITPRNAPPTAAPGALAADTRRPRPAPNLIYHVSDQQAAAASAINLVPVSVPGTPATASPRGSSEQVTLLDARNAQVLPASGWRKAGQPAAANVASLSAPPSPSTPPSVDPFSTQVSRPQPLEQPRQQIIR
jgi:hypothetical protein